MSNRLLSHLPTSSALLFLLFSFLPRLSALDLIFNTFSPSSHLLLYGDATISEPHGHLSITTPSSFSVGRALLPSKISLTSPNSTSILPFSTSFIFSIAQVPSLQPGHGLALLFSPLPGLRGSTSAQHLGLFNRSTDADPSNGVLAVEFDVFQNQEFDDIDNNHVGVDIFSLTSNASHAAGYWTDDEHPSFEPLLLNSGTNYQAWVDYSNSTLNVTLAPAGLIPKPRRPLISLNLDLSRILQPDMYVGFCAATGKLIERHRILAWSFSNFNLSLGDALITSNLPNFIPEGDSPESSSKAVIAGVTTAAAVLALIVITFAIACRRRNPDTTSKNLEETTESWESDYWPHRIAYDQVTAATGNFSDSNLIGSGGNGRVYRGAIAGETVAIKQFHCGNARDGATREFLAEVSSLGRLRHRNLVGLRGWCKGGEDLILVYEYMENGSLEQRLFGGGEPLDWRTRVGILKDVANGVMYLHDGWERRVVHRDIKASNVMLDGEMVGRLGDFGLARMHAHGGEVGQTRVVGTAGYMAPEVVRKGKAGAVADVYAFGVLVLEVASGRRAVEDGSKPLVEWAWERMEGGGEVVEERVRSGKGYNEEEGRRVVRVGLWCTCEDEARRPTMRDVVRALEGGAVELLMLERLVAAGAACSPVHAGCCYHGALGMGRCRERRHPTMEEMGISSVALLTGSDVMLDGR